MKVNLKMDMDADMSADTDMNSDTDIVTDIYTNMDTDMDTGMDMSTLLIDLCKWRLHVQTAWRKLILRICFLDISPQNLHSTYSTDIAQKPLEYLGGGDKRHDDLEMGTPGVGIFTAGTS
jgi:hypothetical protein